MLDWHTKVPTGIIAASRAYAQSARQIEKPFQLDPSILRSTATIVVYRLPMLEPHSSGTSKKPHDPRVTTLTTTSLSHIIISPAIHAGAQRGFLIVLFRCKNAKHVLHCRRRVTSKFTNRVQLHEKTPNRGSYL